MAQIYPLESPGNPQVGGFLITFPSGHRKTVQWQYCAPVKDTLAAAKGLTVKLLTDLMKEGRQAEAEFTNWTSMVAALQKIVRDWSDKLREHLYATGAPIPSPKLILHS